MTKGRFPLPEFTARVHGPSWRPENSGAFFDTRQLGPLTRVVETDLKDEGPWVPRPALCMLYQT